MKKKNFKNIENMDKELSDISGPVALGVIIIAVIVIIIVSIICIASNKKKNTESETGSAIQISVSDNDISSSQNDVEDSPSETSPESRTDTEKETKTTEEGISAPSLTEPTTAIDLKHEFLNEEEHQDISKLIKKYFEAYEKCNASGLMEIVDYNGGIPVTVDQLKERAEIIEKYNDIKCYIIDGLEDGTYVVYAYYNIKFFNIDTSAPTLTRFYVVTHDDKKLSIYNGEISGKLSAFLNVVNSYECVRRLSADVNNMFEKSCNDDKRLGELMKILYEE